MWLRRVYKREGIGEDVRELAGALVIRGQEGHGKWPPLLLLLTITFHPFLLSPQDPPSLDTAIQHALAGLYPPFEATAPTILGQVFRLLDSDFRGDGLSFLLDFLIPAKRLCEQVREAACVSRGDAGPGGELSQKAMGLEVSREGSGLMCVSSQSRS